MGVSADRSDGSIARGYRETLRPNNASFQTGTGVERRFAGLPGLQYQYGGRHHNKGSIEFVQRNAATNNILDATSHGHRVQNRCAP